MNVKANLSIWPHFETQLARGVDVAYNQIAEIPRGEGTPIKNFNTQESLQINGEFIC